MVQIGSLENSSWARQIVHKNLAVILRQLRNGKKGFAVLVHVGRSAYFKCFVLRSRWTRQVFGISCCAVLAEQQQQVKKS